MPPQTKVCNKCKIDKPRTEFFPRKKGSHLIQAACKDCSLDIGREDHKKHKEARNQKSTRWREKNPDRSRETSRRSKLKSNYGISERQYDEMLAAQNGVCKICGDTCSSGKRLAVDHCHTTGKVRGLLCALCNKALGGFKDSPELLSKAIEYLRE